MGCRRASGAVALSTLYTTTLRQRNAEAWLTFQINKERGAGARLACFAERWCKRKALCGAFGRVGYIHAARGPLIAEC